MSLIKYIINENPDDRILKEACSLMKQGQVICAPTDTHWVLLADPFSKEGVDGLYRLKGEHKSHHFSLFCSTISMAGRYAEIPDSSFRLIHRKIPGHYTFIFEAKKKMIKALKASKTDHEVGIRFVPFHFINALIDVHGGPLISTNIDESLVGEDLSPSEIYSYQLEESLRGKVKMIIDPGEYYFVGPSTIYNLSGRSPELIRQGEGKPLF